MTEEKLNLPADAFEPLPKDEAQDNENIADPSLSFAQNVWLRFKQRKAAIISAIIVILMIVVAFGSTPFINKSTLVKSHPQYAKIGRASCRERVKSSEVDVSQKTKEETRETQQRTTK